MVDPHPVIVSGKFVVPATKIGARCRHTGAQAERLEQAVFVQAHQHCLGLFKLYLLQARSKGNIAITKLTQQGGRRSRASECPQSFFTDPRRARQGGKLQEFSSRAHYHVNFTVFST